MDPPYEASSKNASLQRDMDGPCTLEPVLKPGPPLYFGGKMGTAMIRVEEVEYVFENDDRKTMTIGLRGGRKVTVAKSEGIQIAEAVAKHNKQMDQYYRENGGGPNVQQIVKSQSPERSRAEQRVSAIRGEICSYTVPKGPRQ